MNRFTEQEYCVRLLERRTVEENMDESRFLAYAESCAAHPYSAVLLSGGEKPVDGESRYCLAARDPLAVFESKGKRAVIRFPDRVHTLDGNPLEILDRFMESFHVDFPLVVPPFSGGAVGYFAYDLKNCIERLPTTARDDLGLPDMVLFWPGQVLVYDRLERRLETLQFSIGDSGTEYVVSSAASSPPASEAFKIGELESNFRHDDYLSAIGKIRRYIREGDVYQVNLSQRFRFSFEGNAFRLWKALFSMNPAPFYAYIHAGDHRVLSTSMERFLYRRGDIIETRPIKGTRKRGKTPEEDLALSRELAASPKDDAELSMIVDLLRNDLGRVCAGKTIRVTEHKRLETYRNVHHLVSIVTGRLRPDVTHGELLAATFPGGSITGCPKIRAMEIIDELEPNVRHVYTGAIGYLGWHRNLDLNVAIRTALIHRGTCSFSVGGGIVYDSVEEDEFQETLHKGRTLFELIERLRTGDR